MDSRVFKTCPAVFAVGREYQIMVPVKCETLMWVKVGDECFYDDANGTLRSKTDIHRMTVPQKLLDKTGMYTVCYRVIKERKPYFTDTEEEVQVGFKFNAVPDDNIKAYQIADAHNRVDICVKAVKEFEKIYGEIDFFILNGDIPNDSGDVRNFDTIYEIISAVTHGEKPVAYAKGNHDLRGVCAEKMDEYSPVLNGNSFFSFRIGGIWGLSLDCGEDKDDCHAEYGHTVCCHAFRKRETEYIKNIIANAQSEYCDRNVKYKIILSHNPFTEQLEPPFDIEKEIYTQWCTLLKENVKPDIMVSGHFHRFAINEVGGDADHLGQPCRVVIGSKPMFNNGVEHFAGCGLIFADGDIKIIFNDDEGNLY